MRFWNWILRRSREDRELDEELRFHITQETQLRMERGESADAAWRSARRDFGNITLAKEVTRQMWGWTAIERAAQDLRFAVRMLARNAGFTVLALTALALGIGATSAMFTVVNSVLLRPLAFRNPGRLVMVWEVQPSKRTNVVQTQNFLDWRARNRAFENIAALFQIPTNLEIGGEAVQLPGLRVTAGFFEILGTPPLLGRAIRREDDVPGAPSVVVLSYGLWQREFGGRRDAVGQHLNVAGRPAEVIGVMPPDFVFPTMPRVNLYVPMRIDPVQAVRDGRNYSTVARLRPGVSSSHAQEDLKLITARQAQDERAFEGFAPHVEPLGDE